MCLNRQVYGLGCLSRRSKSFSLEVDERRKVYEKNDLGMICKFSVVVDCFAIILEAVSLNNFIQFLKQIILVRYN